MNQLSLISSSNFHCVTIDQNEVNGALIKQNIVELTKNSFPKDLSNCPEIVVQHRRKVYVIRHNDSYHQKCISILCTMLYPQENGIYVLGKVPTTNHFGCLVKAFALSSYSFKFQITKKNVFDLLSWAHHLSFDRLRIKCMKFLRKMTIGVDEIVKVVHLQKNNIPILGTGIFSCFVRAHAKNLSPVDFRHILFEIEQIEDLEIRKRLTYLTVDGSNLARHPLEVIQEVYDFAKKHDWKDCCIWCEYLLLATTLSPVDTDTLKICGPGENSIWLHLNMDTDSISNPETIAALKEILTFKASNSALLIKLCLSFRKNSEILKELLSDLTATSLIIHCDFSSIKDVSNLANAMANLNITALEMTSHILPLKSIPVLAESIRKLERLSHLKIDVGAHFGEANTVKEELANHLSNVEIISKEIVVREHDLPEQRYSSLYDFDLDD